MAAGNAVSGLQSIPNTGTNYIDIRPSSGSEWVIHNIRYGGQVSFAYTDGTNILTYDSDTGSGARLGLVDHVNNTYWIRVTNTGSASILISYDGIQTA